MKTKIKSKRTSILLTLALAVIMVFAMSTAALAAGENLTITINTTASGHTFQAYQVFAGDLSEDEAGNTIFANVVWGSGVNGTALLAALKADTTLGTDFASAASAAEAAEVLGGLNAAKTQAFAQVVGNNLSTTFGASTETTGPYTITGRDAGYYFIKDADGSLAGDDEAYTSFMLQVLGEVNVAPKADTPTVEKKVQENTKYAGTEYGAGYNDVADYNIGDDVPFKLIATMPAADRYAEYESYYLQFNDTISAGLTFNQSSVKVYVDGTQITTGFATAFDGQKMTVTFADTKGIAAIAGSSIITVEYTAELNASAEIGLDGNENEVYLVYSNNPNEDGEGEHGQTPKDEVIVFTYELDVLKVGISDIPDSPTVNLEGAKFLLKRDNNGTTEYALIDANSRLTGWTATEPAEGNLVSDANGEFKVIGLDDGTYYLEETVPPTGYNLLADDIMLVITATTVNGQTYNGTPSTALTALQIAVDGHDPDAGNITTGIVDMTVVNNQGNTLPETGGIGTTLFYIIGGILVAGAAILLVTKKRFDNKAQ